MPKPLQATMPGLVMTYGCVVALEARDPDTGDIVDGVVLRNVTIYGPGTITSTEAENLGPFMIVPGPDSVAGV